MTFLTLHLSATGQAVVGGEVVFGLRGGFDGCNGKVFRGRAGKGAPGQASALRFGGRRVRRLPSGAQSPGPSPNSLRSLRSLRSNRRRQVSLRSALRARARSLPLLSAEEAHCHLPGPTFEATVAVCSAKAKLCLRSNRSSLFLEARPDGAGGTRQGRFQGRRAAQCIRCTQRPPLHEPLSGTARRESRRRRKDANQLPTVSQDRPGAGHHRITYRKSGSVRRSH